MMKGGVPRSSQREKPASRKPLFASFRIVALERAVHSPYTSLLRYDLQPTARRPSVQSLQHQKSEQIRAILHQTDIDCWLVWVRETSQMMDPVLPLIYSGDLVWPSALLYTRSGERLAIVGNFDAGGVPDGLFDRVIPYTEGISATLIEELTRIDPASIAVNESVDDVSADGLTAGMKALLLQILDGTPYADRLLSASPVIGRLRGRKTVEELSRIERAVQITEQIFSEIHRFVHERMASHNVGDAWQADHNPAVDAGPDKAFGHLGPTDATTREGQLLHLDFGVRFEGYCSDLQRMFFFGPPERIPEQVTNAFDTVRSAIAAAERATSRSTGTAQLRCRLPRRARHGRPRFPWKPRPVNARAATGAGNPAGRWVAWSSESYCEPSASSVTARAAQPPGAASGGVSAATGAA